MVKYNEVDPGAIVLIQDTGELWVHGIYIGTVDITLYNGLDCTVAGNAASKVTRKITFPTTGQSFDGSADVSINIVGPTGPIGSNGSQGPRGYQGYKGSFDNSQASEDDSNSLIAKRNSSYQLYAAGGF